MTCPGESLWRRRGGGRIAVPASAVGVLQRAPERLDAPAEGPRHHEAGHQVASPGPGACSHGGAWAPSLAERITSPASSKRAGRG